MCPRGSKWAIHVPRVLAAEQDRVHNKVHDKVHDKGSMPGSADALLESVTGKPLDPSIFMRYLTDKYTALYQL